MVARARQAAVLAQRQVQQWEQLEQQQRLGPQP
jgi:hypothetical protein